jgi:hypothetical protein
MDHIHDRDTKHDGDGRSRGLVPETAPDPVETRDPASRPTPRRSSALLYAIPGLLLLLIGVAWMTWVERPVDGGAAPMAVTGTSGEGVDDPEGRPAGEAPLNPAGAGPSVIGDPGLLTEKQSYVGRAVEIAAVAVMTRPGPRTFWVGRIGNRTLVLADEGAGELPDLATGRIVAISGTLERADEALGRGGLAEDDREAVDGEDVIIRATRIATQERAIPADEPER